MFKKLLTAAAIAVGLTFAVSAGTAPASAVPLAKPAITQDNAGVTQIRHRHRWGHRRHHWRRHYYRPYYYQRHHYYRPYNYGYYGNYGGYGGYPYYYHRRHHSSGIYLSFGRGWY